MASVDWKGSMPLTLFLFAVAAMFYGNVPVQDMFLGPIVLGVTWLLLIPLLAGVGVKKDANPWFIRAGTFAFIGAAFMLLDGTFINSGAWSQWLVQISMILSWLMASVGGLVILGTAK